MNTVNRPCGVNPQFGLASAVIAIAGAGAAYADVTTYTSSEAFFDALGETPVTIEGFESYALDSIIGPGETLNGVTYDTWPDVFGGLVGDNFADFDVQSLYLERDGVEGQGEFDFFFPGDSFSVTFSKPVTAVGLFFNVGPSDDVSDYLFIETPVGAAASGGPKQDINTFFFVGLISDEPFDSATLGSTRVAPTGWNADNLIFGADPGDDCPADLDGDGNVGTGDLILLLGAWGTDPGGPPDFDGDGNVGTGDLIVLLGNWGPCPK